MIYVVTHRPVKYVPKSRDYQMIAVGSCNRNIYPCHDAVGANISQKNYSFCELTALYWIWKNKKGNVNDIVGLVHYRRFFVKHIWYMIDKRIPMDYRLYSQREASRILEKYDFIVPQKITFDITVKDYYAKYHYEKDIYALRDVIEDLFPAYLESFDKVMDGKEMFAYNMFITTCHQMDSYCEWIFKVLFELESRIDISTYNDTQKRIFGYLSERMFNVYCMHHQKKLYYAFCELIDNPGTT